MQQLLEELFDLTKRQHQALLEDKYEVFIQLLQERQVIITQIKESNDLQDESFSEENRKILQKIEELDTINREEYIRQLEDTKKQLKNIKESQIKNEAYIGSYNAFAQGMHFDSK